MIARARESVTSEEAGSLVGRVALVTGSSGGIGLAIADTLGRHGARVVVHGLEPPSEIERRVGTRLAGVGWECVSFDIGDAGGTERVLDAMAARAVRPDILVINASIEIRQGWREVTETDARLQLESNLVGTIRIIQKILPGMIEAGWGRVIAIGSVQEYHPRPDRLVYAATKAALTNIILNLGASVRAPGLTFNVVQPGAIETDRNRSFLANPGNRGTVVDQIPLGRIGSPEDCCGMVAFLCARESGYVNGALIPIDGGMRL